MRNILNKFVILYKRMHINNRIVIKNVAVAFLVKGGALLLTLFTMPAYIRFFNNDITLGLWFTISSIFGWILNFDLGIGNGLRNHLTKAIAQNEPREAKKYISSAYASIGVICFIACVVLLVLVPSFEWNTILNVDENVVSKKALICTLIISSIGIALQMFFKLIQSVLYALQRSSLNNILSLVTSSLTLGAVLLIPSKDNDRNIVVMSIIHVLAVIGPLVVTSIIVFLQKKTRTMSPSLKYIYGSYVKKVMSLGGAFFYIQVIYMLLLATNEYLITLLCGNENVVEYRVYYQVFSLGGTLFMLILTPVWSVITKAMAENDYKWILNLYRKALKLLIIAAIGEFLIVAFLQLIFNLWLQQEAPQVNYLYAICFAIFGIMFIINGLTSTMANGLGMLKTQAICFTVGVVIKFATTGLFVSVFDSWIGVQVASVVSMLPFCIAQPIVLNKYLKSKIKGEK